MKLQQSIRRILSEESFIPSPIRRRISHEELEEAFEYALEQNALSMTNPDSILFKDKEHTTLELFAKFVIDDMVTIIEQDYFGDENRIYFSNDEEDYVSYHENIRKPLLKQFGKRIKEKFDEVKFGNINESDPKTGTGKKPKGSGRRLYTDENPKDTVSVKFRTKEDIVDTLNKESFKSKPHKRQSQIINLIHQRVRAAYENAKDPETKKRLKRAYDYISQRKEKSKEKTKRLQNKNEMDEELGEYSRTLKNARKHGVGLRFPKSAIKANPLRFRPYTREKMSIKEVRVPREERVELYKDENIIVVVPLTHRALQKYAHRCQWCINQDKSEWEDYHQEKHAVIIQRNPKKVKMGITGNPTASEILILERWDSGHYKFRDVCGILGYEFKDEIEMGDYYVNITNDINNFATNIVYYSPENGLYDMEDNYLWNFGIEINDIPNVTPEVIKMMDDYLQKNEETQIQESIRRILREENENKAEIGKVRLVEKLIKTIYPNFNKEGVNINSTGQFRHDLYSVVLVYRDKQTDEWYAKYDHDDYQLLLNRKVFEKLDSILGPYMDYVVDWFNNEFDKDAEYVTF